jgi:hypothetical protein
LAGWVKEMVFQMLWDDFITGDPLYHHLRYMEIIRNPAKLKICSKFAPNLAASRRQISCQYHNFAKIADM